MYNIYMYENGQETGRGGERIYMKNGLAVGGE